MNNAVRKTNPFELSYRADIKLPAVAGVLPQMHEWTALIEAKNEAGNEN